MKTLTRFALAAALLAVPATAPPAAAQHDGRDFDIARFDPGVGIDVPIEELESFRDELLSFHGALTRLSPAARQSPHGGAVLARSFAERLLALDEEELRILYESYDDHALFSLSIQRIVSFAGDLPPLDAPRLNAISGTLTPVADPEYSALCGAVRDNADIIDGFRIAYNVANTAAIIAQALCDSLVVILGEGTNAPACVAAGIANEAAEVARVVIDLEVKCNEDIAEAQVDVTHENVRTIVDAVQCLPVSTFLRGHGCDGADNDCDRVIDDCAEDVFGPEVHLDAAVYGQCFKSVDEALAAVAAAVQATDDCWTITVDPPIATGTECDVPISVTARDACGNETTVQTLVKVDSGAAAITIDPAVAGACYQSVSSAEAAVLGAATFTDNCSDPEDLSITVKSTVTDCQLRVRLDVVDECGNASSAAVTVRVDTALPSVDTERLLLGFRGEVLGFQTPPCFASVADAEAAVLAATRFADNCSPSEQVAASASSAGDPCRLVVTPLGEDECGLQNTDAVTVRVDQTPPLVTSSVALTELWPANHGMVDVGFDFSVEDDCTGDPDVEIRITSDERTAGASGAGRASPAPDAEILRELDGSIAGILLRSERSMSDDGRVYRIDVKATDACGNVGHAQSFVTVPRNGSQTAVDSGQYYDATLVN
jgi:hypothetical protein